MHLHTVKCDRCGTSEEIMLPSPELPGDWDRVRFEGGKGGGWELCEKCVELLVKFLREIHDKE